MVCDAGPQAGWESLGDLTLKTWQQGWEVLKVQVEGDCDEVYARNEQGQAIEAFFHAATLDKLGVFRRDQEIFRKDGFTG